MEESSQLEDGSRTISLEHSDISTESSNTGLKIQPKISNDSQNKDNSSGEKDQLNFTDEMQNTQDFSKMQLTQSNMTSKLCPSRESDSISIVKDAENSSELKESDVSNTTAMNLPTPSQEEDKIHNTANTESVDDSVKSGTGLSEASEDTDYLYTDENGRTFYYAENKHLCRYETGEVYYLDSNKEWKLWGSDEEVGEQKWYFYKGDDAYYQDQTTNNTYKFDKSSNQWTVCKKRKRKAANAEVEEEDTDSESEYESEPDDQETIKKSLDPLISSGKAPLGYNTDPNIKLNANVYTRFDPSDNMTYEWDESRKAWFPKVSFH